METDDAASDAPPKISKNQLKKQAKAAYKKEMKTEHHAKEHAVMLEDARRLLRLMLRSRVVGRELREL